MNQLKKLGVFAFTVFTLAAVSIYALAESTYRTPAEAAAGVTGSTVESVTEQRANTGKTYGMIAAEAGKLEEFKKAVLELRKENLREQVTAGTITKEQAETMIAALVENQAVCDGSGSAEICKSTGTGFCGAGSFAAGNGGGRAVGCGGMGKRNGSCFLSAE